MAPDMPLCSLTYGAAQTQHCCPQCCGCKAVVCSTSDDCSCPDHLEAGTPAITSVRELHSKRLHREDAMPAQLAQLPWLGSTLLVMQQTVFPSYLLQAACHTPPPQDFNGPLSDRLQATL